MPDRRPRILEVRPRVDAVRLRQEVEDHDCGEGRQEDDEATSSSDHPFLEPLWYSELGQVERYLD